MNRFRVAFEHPPAPPRLHIPQAHDALGGAGQGAAAIMAPRHAPNSLRVAFEQANRTPGLYIPQP